MFVTGLCLVMQVLALMPHHHHGEDDALCFNISHCIEITDSHSHSDMACSADCECECDHRHDHSHNTRDGKCMAGNMAVVRFDRDGIRINVLDNDDILQYATFTVGSADDACGHCYFDNITDLRMRQNPGVPPVHTGYIAEALQPRAPSFTA